MIQSFVDQWMAVKDKVRASLTIDSAGGYDDLFRLVVKALSDDNTGDAPDPERITVIDHGHYQGTRVFVVGGTGYQPFRYWACAINYGSCSGCDAFEASISTCEYDSHARQTISDKAKDEWMAMMLHMVQSLVEVTR